MLPSIGSSPIERSQRPEDEMKLVSSFSESEIIRNTPSPTFPPTTMTTTASTTHIPLLTTMTTTTAPPSPIPELDSTPCPRDDDYDPTVGAKPYSPFYRHATPSYKLDRVAIHPEKSHSSGDSSLDDLESGDNGGCKTTARPKKKWQRLSDDDQGARRESKLWMQEKRACDCLRGLTKTQRMVVKAAIAVVILGSMVAIALGITAAVGGGVWKSNHQQETFPG